MPEDLNIDVAGAEAAFEAAGINPIEAGAPAPNRDPFARDDAGRFAAQTSEPAPVADAPVAEPAATSPEGTATEPESFTHIDDAAILAGGVTPEMMVQYRKSLQADYTKKAMEVAEWRKLAESGLSLDDQRNAAELYGRLQDPNSLSQFHEELTGYMEAHGVPRAAALAAATNQVAQIAPAEEYDDGGYEDPSLAPVVQTMKQMQAQIERLTAAQSQSLAERQQQEQFNATAQRLTQEEATIRAANPTYQDADIVDIYELMGPEGDLLGAQRRFESIIGARLARYMQSKESAHATTATPVAGGGVIPAPVDDGPLTAEEGHRRALAHVRELDALDA